MIRSLKTTLILAGLAGSTAAIAQAPPPAGSGPSPGRPPIVKMSSPEPAANAKLSSTQLLSRIEIESLGIEYFFLLDHGQSDKLANLFTEDGVMNSSKGREAIRKYYAARSTTTLTRHVSTNLRLVFDGEDKARGVRILTHYSSETGEPKLAEPSVAEYHETYVRGADGQWRFASRIIEPVFDKKP